MSEKLKNMLAMTIFGSVGLFVRFIPLSSSLIALARAVIGLAFLVAFVLLRREKFSFSAIRKNLPILLLSGAALGFNWILLFEAYRYTTVASATLCYYLAPVFVILLSPILFKERLTPLRIACVLAALCGMVFVSGVLDGGQIGVGILFGVGAAVLYATVVILNKKLSDVSAYERTIAQFAVSAVFMLPYCLLIGDFSDISLVWYQWLLLVLVGVLHTGIAYALYFGSINKLPSQTVAMLAYIDPVLALVLSFLVLGEPIGIYGIIGAVLILGSMALCEMLERKVRKSEN